MSTKEVITFNKLNSLTINIKKENNYVFIDNLPSSCNKTIRVKCAAGSSTCVNIYTLIKNQSLSYKIDCTMQKKCKCVINFFCFCLQKGKSTIIIDHTIPQLSFGCTLKQNIVGLCLDNTSSIKATPAMDVNCNKVMAEHSVRVGHLSDDELFYLQSKSLSKQQSTKLLISSMFGDINEGVDDKGQKIINLILNNIEREVGCCA